MKLGVRQEQFMRHVPRLIDQAHKLGFEIRGGSLFRDPRLHGKSGHPDIMTWLEANFPAVHAAAIESGYQGYGSRVSEHKNKCAIDLNLRHQGGDMAWSTDDHSRLGVWWEQQHEMCRWGGRFNDGNHYEFLDWR